MTIKNYAQLQVPPTTIDTNDSETDEDTDVAEEQIAINKKQKLTGDPLPSVLQFETWKIKSINVLLGKTTSTNIFYWTMILKF